MKGKIITSFEVKARWAYGEINSERFGRSYQQTLPQSLYNRAKQNYSFNTISESEHASLVRAIEIARPGFVDNVDTLGSSKYECVEWGVNELLSCVTIPMFGGGMGNIEYYRFLAMPDALNKKGDQNDADPRFRSATIPFDPAFEVSEPLIAVDVGRHMLLEGYLRSLLWLRNPIKALPVWIPMHHN